MARLEFAIRCLQLRLEFETTRGQRPDGTILGGDYDTQDSTRIRDYDHVCDLAEGQVFAVLALAEPGIAAFAGGVLQGRHARALVTSVAVGLVGTPATAAEPNVLPCFELRLDGTEGSDDGLFWHDRISLGMVRLVRVWDL